MSRKEEKRKKTDAPRTVAILVTLPRLAKPLHRLVRCNLIRLCLVWITATTSILGAVQIRQDYPHSIRIVHTIPIHNLFRVVLLSTIYNHKHTLLTILTSTRSRGSLLSLENNGSPERATETNTVRRTGTRISKSLVRILNLENSKGPPLSKVKKGLLRPLHPLRRVLFLHLHLSIRV